MKAIMRDEQEMKDSGIDWIAYIPNNWKVNVLFQVTSQVKNKNLELKEQNLLSLSYGKIKRKDINTNEGLLPASFENYNIVEKDDIVLRLTDLQNDHKSLRVGHVNERGIITSAYVTLHPNVFINSNYLYYVLHMFDLKKGFYGMGAGVRQGLTYDEVKTLKICYPSMLEQQAIANYLDDRCSKIDAIIAEAKASIEEYMELKQAVIYEALTKGLNKNVPMKNSGIKWIGKTPANWEVTQLKRYIDILPGYAFSSEDFAKDGIPLLLGINVTPNGTRWDDVVYWNQSVDDNLLPYMLKDGDIVIGLDRPWISEGTRALIVNETDLPCLLLQRVCRIRVSSNVDYRFIYYWLIGKSFENALTSDTTGISVPHISTSQIGNFIISFPSLSEQILICDYIDKKVWGISSLISEKQSLIEDLESYKKSLIYEVVTGKRKVVA